MSAFPESGRFDWQETTVFKVRYRPGADIEGATKNRLFRELVGLREALQSSAHNVDDVDETVRTHSNVVSGHELAILITIPAESGYLMAGEIQHKHARSMRKICWLFTAINHENFFLDR